MYIREFIERSCIKFGIVSARQGDKGTKGGREHRKLISRPRDFPPNSRIFRVTYIRVVTAYPSK